MNVFTKSMLVIAAVCLGMLAAALTLTPQGYTLIDYGEDKIGYVKSDLSNGKTVFAIDYLGPFSIQNSEKFAESVNYIKSQIGDGDIVLVRIESPGGSTIACTHSFNQIEKLKKTGAVVVTVSDYLATSCGYMLLSAGDKVYASGGAAVGNIGVYSKFGVSRLPIIGSSRVKELLAGDKPNNKDDVALLRNKVERLNNQFKLIVLLNRSESIDVADYEKVFSGDSFSGYEAFGNGLVDQIIDHRTVLIMYKEAGYNVLTLKYDEPISIL